MVLATQLPSIANAMDVPMEQEKATKKRELSSEAAQIEEERKHIIIPLMQEDLENNIIDNANRWDLAAQDALMDLYYQGRYRSVISSQIQFTFHLWEDIRRKCCEKDEYAYFFALNYQKIRQTFVKDSFAAIHAGIKKRAELEDPKALCNEAVLYFYGHGVPQDLNKANDLFKSAANKNHAPSQYSIAFSYINGEQPHELQPTSKAVNKKPQFSVAFSYINGEQPHEQQLTSEAVNKKPHEMPPDSEIFQCAQKAAWQGYAPAQNFFHTFLQSNSIENCDGSVREFNSHLLSEADQGYSYYSLERLADAVDIPDMHAQYNLAQFYARAHDWLAANEYYNKAAANGHKIAKSKLESPFKEVPLELLLQPLSSCDSGFKNMAILDNLCLVSKDWQKTIYDWIETKPGLNPINFDLNAEGPIKTHKRIRSLPLSLSCLFYNTDETLEFPKWTKHDPEKPLSIHSFHCTLGLSRHSKTPNFSLIPKVNELFENLSSSINDLEVLNFFGTPGLFLGSIKKCLQSFKLKELALKRLNINGLDIQTIIENLPENLQLLNLIGNNFGDDECSAFLKKLPQLPNLKILCLGEKFNTQRHQEFQSYAEFNADNGLTSYRGGSQNRKTVIETGAPVISKEVLDDFKAKLDADLPKLEYLIFN